MFNPRRDKGKPWLQDDSSLSSDSEESNNNLLRQQKRFRHNQTEQMNAAMARMASNQAYNQPNPMAVVSMPTNPPYGGVHAQFHHEETSLVNSKTGDGLETGFHRESKYSHAGRPFSGPSHVGTQMSGEMLHQMQNFNKRERKYSVPKKKQKSKTIGYRIQKIFSKVDSDENKSEFIKHIFDNVTEHMSREDYKTLLIDHINSNNDLEHQLQHCKEIQKLLSMKLTNVQSAIEKKKKETSISDELQLYLNKVPNFNDNVFRFMIAEGLTTVQFLIWVPDDCWDDFLRKPSHYNVKSRDIHMLRKISYWLKSNEEKEDNKVLPEDFNMSYLDCFQQQSRKPHYRHGSKPARGRGRNYFPHSARYNTKHENHYGGGHYRPPPQPPLPNEYNTKTHYNDVGYYGPSHGGYDTNTTYATKTPYDTKPPYEAKPAAKLTATEGWSSLKPSMKWTKPTDANDKDQTNEDNVNTENSKNNENSKSTDEVACNENISNDSPVVNVPMESDVDANPKKTVSENDVQSKNVVPEQKGVDNVKEAAIINTTGDEKEGVEDNQNTFEEGKSDVDEGKTKLSSSSDKSNDKAVAVTDNNVAASSDKLNVSPTKYNMSDLKFLETDKRVDAKLNKFKLFYELHSRGIDNFLKYEEKAKECGDETYLKMKSPEYCSYSIYNHCNCENLIEFPYVQCNDTGCNKKMHKMCFFKMYSLYSPWSKHSGKRLLDTDVNEKSNSDNNEFRFSFPIHKKVKELEMGIYYCPDHLGVDTGSYQEIQLLQGPDLASYINSFLSCKKESITKEETFGFRKETIIEKYRKTLMNQRAVREIDNLIYWSIVMPPADYTYEILKEYTKDESYLCHKSSKEEKAKYNLTDDQYLQSKNIATCIAVDYVKINEKYFTEIISSNDASDDSYKISDDEDDVPIGNRLDINDYANIAMTARFCFSEVSFICPCHTSNEYYFRMHKVAQPENWCTSKRKHFKNLNNLCAHLKQKSSSCYWHKIYSVFFKNFVEQEGKK